MNAVSGEHSNLMSQKLVYISRHTQQQTKRENEKMQENRNLESGYSGWLKNVLPIFKWMYSILVLTLFLSLFGC